MSTPARRPGFASFKPFDLRHVAPPPPPVVEDIPPPPPKPSTVARPLRLAAAVDAKLHQLAAARGDLSLNAVVSLAIAEEWSRVFRPSTEILAEQMSALVGAAMAATRYPSDTTYVPNDDGRRSSRTLRLTPDIDRKLGELATHYGELDRNSTVAMIIASAWRRIGDLPRPAPEDAPR